MGSVVRKYIQHSTGQPSSDSIPSWPFGLLGMPSDGRGDFDRHGGHRHLRVAVADRSSLSAAGPLFRSAGSTQRSQVTPVGSVGDGEGTQCDHQNTAAAGNPRSPSTCVGKVT